MGEYGESAHADSTFVFSLSAPVTFTLSGSIEVASDPDGLAAQSQPDS